MEDMSELLIDTHCHLHDREWFTPEQAEEFLQDASARNVKQVIVIGTDPVDSQAARDFAIQHPGVFWTYGVHPEYANSYFSKNNVEQSGISVEQARNLFYRESPEVTTEDEDARHPRRRDGATSCLEKTNERLPSGYPVAIGEIGLDYHYEGYDRDLQIRLFEQMLQLAQDLALPVSLHIREAYADAWAVLDNFPKVTGVVHSFTGSKKELRTALARGFYIGVNGLVTYTTPALPPLENMVLETDAPFLTPVPFRGTINKPGYVSNIAAYLGKKLGEQEAKIVEQTTQNARHIFRLRDAIIRPNQGV